jgi:hypothetical protein
MSKSVFLSGIGLIVVGLSVLRMRGSTDAENTRVATAAAADSSQQSLVQGIPLPGMPGKRTTAIRRISLTHSI